MKHLNKNFVVTLLIFLTQSFNLSIAQSNLNGKDLFAGTTLVSEFENSMVFIGKVNDKLLFMSRNNVSPSKNTLFYTAKPKLYIIDKTSNKIINTVNLKQLFKSNKITDAYVIKGRIFFSIQKSGSEIELFELDESGEILSRKSTANLGLKNLKPNAIIPSADGQYLLLINQSGRMDLTYGKKRSRKTNFAVLDLKLNLIHKGLFTLNKKCEYLKITSFVYSSGNITMLMATNAYPYIGKIDANSQIVKLGDWNSMSDFCVLNSSIGEMKIGFISSKDNIGGLGLIVLNGGGEILSNKICETFKIFSSDLSRINTQYANLVITDVLESSDALTFIIQNFGTYSYVRSGGSGGVTSSYTQSYSTYNDIYIIKQDANFSNMWTQHVRNRFSYNSTLIDYTINGKLFLYYTSYKISTDKEYNEGLPLTNEIILSREQYNGTLGKCVVFDFESGEHLKSQNISYLSSYQQKESGEHIIWHRSNNKFKAYMLVK